MVGFIFGGNTGVSSPQELERRRAIAEMLATGASRAPKDVGEGLTAIGQALSFRMMDRRNRKDAEAGRAQGDKAFANLFSMFGSQPDTQAPEMAGGTAVAPSTAPQPMDYPSQRVAQAFGDNDLKSGIEATAQSLGIDPIDLATAISYETAGTFDPMKKGPTTQWGQHQGLIQFGEPQAQKYGVDWNNPVGSQLGPDGAVAKYLKDTGVKPGMGLLDIYSAINAGGVGRYDASDANNGGAPGTVADKVRDQMAGHRQKAMSLLGAQAGPQAPQMATAPVQVAQADGAFPPPPPAPQGNNRLQMLMQAAQNPWLTPEQKGVVNMMLEQEMAKMDPNAGLDAEYKRMQIRKLESDIATANAPDARKKFGLNPQYGVDANGNPVLLQLGDNGEAMQTQLPPGVTLSKEPIRLDAGDHWVLLDPITRQPVGQVQKNVASEAAQSEAGKAQGAAQAGLGNAEAGYNTAVEQIDAILNHPGLDSSVGTLQGRIPDALAGAMNSDVADFRTRVAQLQGQTFLRAFEALKGGGAITEIEGKKAEQAIGRLNQAVSEQDFKAALSDLRTILDRGIEAYRRKAGVISQPADGWQDMGGGVRMRVKQ